MLLAFIDIYQGLISQGTPRYGIYKVKARNGPVSTVPTLLERSGDPIAASALRRVCVTKKTWAHIDINAASAFASRDSLTAAITTLEQMSLLEVMPSQVEHQYQILKTPPKMEDIIGREYTRFQDREKRELARIGEVLAFLTANDCHAKLLTEHFEGSNGPSSSTHHQNPFPCGVCPFCKSGSPLKLKHVNEFKIDPYLWTRLERDEKLPRDDPQLVARYALGFKSPRINQLGLPRSVNFGLMIGVPYAGLISMIMSKMFPNMK